MIAVIDIGSNSVRLMLSHNEVVEKTVITTRLGEGLNSSGQLSEAAIERTTKAVNDFVNIAKSYTAENIFIYATEAVRAAANGKKFCDIIKNENGITVQLLSGEEEAACSFYGVITQTGKYSQIISGDKTRLYGVVDIGGASTELVVGNINAVLYSSSAPYGIVRIKDYAGEKLNKIDEFLSNVSEKYKNIPIFDELIGIGGTLTSLAAIKLNLQIYNREAVHGTKIFIEDLFSIKKRILSTPLLMRGKIKGLNPSRTDTIIGGICIAEKIMELTNKKFITVSENDNLEGYWLLKQQGKI